MGRAKKYLPLQTYKRYGVDAHKVVFLFVPCFLYKQPISRNQQQYAWIRKRTKRRPLVTVSLLSYGVEGGGMLENGNMTADNEGPT